MSDRELGPNTCIKEDKVAKYIVFKGDEKTKDEPLYLEDKPMAFQQSIPSFLHNTSLLTKSTLSKYYVAPLGLAPSPNTRTHLLLLHNTCACGLEPVTNSAEKE